MRWKSRVAIAALVTISACAAEVRITDADQRFKIKYGTYPPHVQRAMQAKAEERKARMTKLFSRIDRNEDGRISESEWRKSGRSEERFFAYDRDENGFITHSEWSGS
jgi:Ca2+-binding EF-hand superfamily protein